MDPKQNPKKLKPILLQHFSTMKTGNYRTDSAKNNLNPKQQTELFKCTKNLRSIFQQKSSYQKRNTLTTKTYEPFPTMQKSQLYQIANDQKCENAHS